MPPPWGRRGPRAASADGAGAWFAQIDADIGADYDPDEDVLAEAMQLGVNTAVRGQVLHGALGILRSDPAPRFSHASGADAGGCYSDGGGGRRPRSRDYSPGAAPRVPLEAVNASAVPSRGPRPPRAGLPLPRSSLGSGRNGAPGSPVLAGAGALAAGMGLARARGSGLHEDSLVASMAARLAQVEHLNQALSERFTKQNEELQILRGAGREPSDGGGSGDGAEVGSLRGEVARLRKQVEDMTHFLADYGLMWVPRNESVKSQGEEAAVPDSDIPAKAPGVRRRPQGTRSEAATQGVQVDIKVIQARVESLNALLERPTSEVAREGGIARLVGDVPLPLPLTFFSDGLKLADHAFMQYESPTAQQIIKDVLDGYFPSLLLDHHPDGIELRAVDRTGNDFVSWWREFSRNDPDLMDGGEKLRPLRGCGAAVCDPRADLGHAERLVAKLPDKVIRKGRVIDVRGPIAEKLGIGMPQGAAVRGASEDRAAKGDEAVSLLEVGRDAGNPMARLQVKLEGGQRVLLLMEPHATIGDLWDALARWRASHQIARFGFDGKRCSLRSAFPPRSWAFDERSESLGAAGLVPGAALFVHAEGS